MEEKRSGASHLLSVGDKAPAFSLRDQNGNLVTLKEFKTRKNVVLVFYPGDNTPGCTKQLCAIRDQFKLFADNDTVVFGINPQDPSSHKKFISRRSLPFTSHPCRHSEALSSCFSTGGRLFAKGTRQSGKRVITRAETFHSTRPPRHLGQRTASLPPPYQALRLSPARRCSIRRPITRMDIQ
jgi:hypothetical protein